MKKNFFENYYKDFINLDIFSEENIKNLNKSVEIFKKIKIKNNKIFFFGNGGSSATASHVSNDLTKNAKIRSLVFTDAAMITCLSNDYGYENWMKKALEFHCDLKDLVVFISASGNSKNIIRAMNYCKKKKIKVISFTGMNNNNKLNNLNREGIKFWINSKSYNLIEVSHMFLLVSIIDKIIGRSVYSSKR